MWISEIEHFSSSISRQLVLITVNQCDQYSSAVRLSGSRRSHSWRFSFLNKNDPPQGEGISTQIPFTILPHQQSFGWRFRHISKNDFVEAIDDLQDFIHKVQQQSGKLITTDEAARLTGLANALVAEI
jgi:hypothetical protein